MFCKFSAESRDFFLTNPFKGTITALNIPLVVIICLQAGPSYVIRRSAFSFFFKRQKILAEKRQ